MLNVYKTVVLLVMSCYFFLLVCFKVKLFRSVLNLSEMAILVWAGVELGKSVGFLGIIVFRYFKIAVNFI